MIAREDRQADNFNAETRKTRRYRGENRFSSAPSPCSPRLRVELESHGAKERLTAIRVAPDYRAAAGVPKVRPESLKASTAK
jgi:hypothetical protein